MRGEEAKLEQNRGEERKRRRGGSRGSGNGE
jgi:hypothetical protein